MKVRKFVQPLLTAWRGLRATGATSFAGQERDASTSSSRPPPPDALPFAVSDADAAHIPVIDREHEDLLKSFERIRDQALLGGLSACRARWTEFRTALNWHFQTEERLMRAAAYPDAERHTSEHRAFRHQIDAMQEEMTGGSEWSATFAFRSIPAWFVQHRLDHDRPLHEFLISATAVSGRDLARQ